MEPKHCDPAQLLVETWLAASRNEIAAQQAFEIAASESLARAATSETVRLLLARFAELAPHAGRGALLLAVLIESHASKLDDLGRSLLAVPLYGAIHPIFEQCAPPRQRANCLMNGSSFAERLAGQNEFC